MVGARKGSSRRCCPGRGGGGWRGRAGRGADPARPARRHGRRGGALCPRAGVPVGSPLVGLGGAALRRLARHARQSEVPRGVPGPAGAPGPAGRPADPARRRRPEPLLARRGGPDRRAGGAAPPVPPLPPLLAGVVLRPSWLAAAAVIVGLALRPSGSRRARAGALALGVLGALGAVWARGWSPDSALNRLAVWRLAWDDLWAVPVTLLTGCRARGRPPARPARPTAAAGQGWPPELFAAAHSDLVRLGFEGGALALAVLGLWILAHRAAWWRSPWRGAAAALAGLGVGLHPMHLASIAVPACVVLGAATART